MEGNRVISLSALAQLAQEYRDDLDRSVAPVRIGLRTFDLDSRPAVMGCINLSRDSSYRDSVAVSADSAVRRGRILAAQGADVIDLGAESSTPRAPRVSPDEQIAALVPVVGRLSALAVPVSVETYHPGVAEACFKAGARMLNYSGGAPYDHAVFDAVARYDAAMVLCHVPGSDAKDLQMQREDVQGQREGLDPIPRLLDHFAPRVEAARDRGVVDIVLDPGIGFSGGSLPGPGKRVNRQARTLLNTFRLRRLGLPVCHALPHAFDVFEDQYRGAEPFFAVLAHLGGCGMFRTHEVARVVAVLAALQALGSG
jgi:dihydropteroate synthase